MSIPSQLHRISRILTVSHQLLACLLLPLLCACTLVTESYNSDDPTPPQSPTADYINISIVVSSGNEGTTRAPQGGENGDGREAGSERENKVTGITLMLYQDDAGINTTGNPTIDFIQYYPVTEGTRDSEGKDYGDNKTDEAIYSTGDQLLSKDIKKDVEYHVIVVANMNLTTKYTVGSLVKDIREEVTQTIYSGTGIGIDANRFIMASEEDYSFILSDVPQEKSENKIVYKLGEKKVIRIERLAARVDFWMKGAEYKEEHSGYKYNVYDKNNQLSNDYFVLTAVTPFNLYNGNEFLIKHINNGEGSVKYLEDENNNSLVIDPETSSKSSKDATTYYDNRLEALVDYDYNQKKNTLAGAKFYGYQTTKDLFDNKEDKDKSQFATFEGIGDDVDNFILCYPRENALPLASLLYYYATGVAIEGNYYHYDATTNTYESKHLVYYGYLRHQGEPYNSDTYPITTAEKLDKEAAGSQSTAMNFSVVRNNIYRISIDKITEKGEESKDPEITWQIKVKKWDEFKHDTIYM